MMLLKRLLLPGKGGLIICIFIFINVLLWRAEPEKEAANYRDLLNYTVTLVITSLLYKCLLSSKSVSNASWCKYYGVAIVMFYYFSSLQFHRVYASEEVFDASKAHTPQPVFNKTDPLSMTLALNKGGGGASLIATQHNDYNYNKGRRRPVHNNSSSNSRINSKSRSGGIISSNSSNFLNNSVLNTISLSGGGSVLLEGGAGNSSIGNSTSGTVQRNNADNNEMTDSSNLKLSSDNSTLLSMKRKKGKTRKVSVRISASRNNQSRPAKVKRRKPKLLKELTMFNRQNCLAKLLCGVQVAQPPTKSSSALNDYAYLVKAFFDRFSIKGIVTDVIDTAFQYEQDAQDNLDDEIDADLRGDESEILGDDQDDDDDDSSDDERRKKKGPVKLGNKYIGGAALHKARRPQYNYNVKYYKEYDADLDDVDLDFLDLVDDDIPEFMQPDVLRKRQGKKFVKPFNQTESGNVTVLARRKRRSRPIEINRVRRKRGIVGEVKRGFMGFFNPRFDKTAYLDKRQLDLTSEEDEGRQLTIAEEIVKRLRSPRQCRLLNWFGNTDSKSTQTTSANGMTTTITTITNTGGMVGNLDKLSHLQTGLPQSSINAGGSGSQGSQVVTVIQQTPVGAPTSSTPTTSSAKPIFNAKATEMLNNFGQSASSAMSSAMSQAGDVASHAGNTICPFNIQELQELILKAQTAPFPHFLTTTPAPPAKPFPAFPRETANESPTAATSTSSTPTLGTTTTIKATQPPPPSTTTIDVHIAPGRGRGQTRNGLDSSFSQLYGDFSPEGHPSPPRYPHSSQNSDAEDDDDDDSETPYYQQPTSPAPPHYHNRHKPPQRKPPNFYTTLTPIFPSPMYPSPTHPSEYMNQADQQTRQPDIIPSIGVSEGYQDNFFEDNSQYGSYEKNKVPSPFDRHKVHHHPPGLRRKKPTPKWMTTTPVPEDELFDYNNNAVPNPSFGFGTPHFGHKPQRQQGYKNPISKLYHQEKQGSYNKRPVHRSQNSMGYNRPMHHPNEFKVRPDLPKEPDPTPNYIREFHQPPVVVDSNNRIINAGYRQTSPQGNPNTPVRGQNQNSGQNKNPQQQRNKPQNNEDSDEDDSESSDDDSDESSSTSAEARAALPPPPPPELPPDLSGRPPTGPAPPPLPPPTEGSLEASEEDDDTSNEAQERKEKGAENDEEDEEESDEEEDGDDENDGKRSYERNDFSKDRGGPPSESTTTENPNSKKVEYADNGSSSSGFISNFLNSINPFSSFFKRDSEKSKRENMIRNSNNYNHANPSPPSKQRVVPPRPHSVNVPSNFNSNEESDEPENDDDESDDEENSEEDASKAVIPKPPKRKPVRPPPKQKIIQKPKRKINLQMNTKIPIDPWVHGDTQLQISLKTTPVPVVIESSSSWARPFWDREEDDSGEEDLRENPVSEAVKNKKKDSVVTLPEKKQNLDFFTGLGLSPGLSEFLNDLSLTNTKKKESKDPKEAQKKVVKKPATTKPLEQDDDGDEEDDESNESEEDNGPPRRLPHPHFMPPEPID